MRGTQNTIRDLHIVEVSRRDRRIGVVCGVFAQRLLVRNVSRLRSMTNLMHMRRHNPAQHEGQQEHIRAKCAELVDHRETKTD